VPGAPRRRRRRHHPIHTHPAAIIHTPRATLRLPCAIAERGARQAPIRARRCTGVPGDSSAAAPPPAPAPSCAWGRGAAPHSNIMAAATSLIAAALCNSAACGGAQAIHFLQPHIVFSNQSARPPLPYSPDGFPTAPTAYFTSLLGDGTATMFGNLGHEHVGSNDTSGHWLFAESSTGGTSWSINARTPITSPITQNVLLPDPAACNGCWRNLGNLGIRPGNWAGESGWVYKGGYTVFKPTASGGIETVVPDAQSTVSFGGIPAPGMNTTANLLHYYPLVMSALRISSPSAAHPSVDPHNSTSHDGGKNTVLATAIVTLNDAPYNKGVGTFINPTSVAAFRSEDNGHSFHFVSYIAKQADFPWSTYGPTEHDCSLLADGKTLTCIIRMDADGPCTWSCECMATHALALSAYMQRVSSSVLLSHISHTSRLTSRLTVYPFLVVYLTQRFCCSAIRHLLSDLVARSGLQLEHACAGAKRRLCATSATLDA
jgi:hypothetical protein